MSGSEKTQTGEARPLESLKEMGIGESNGDRVRRRWGLWIRLTRDTGILYLNVDHNESLVTIFGAQLEVVGH
jgi:hypothetical protein